MTASFSKEDLDAYREALGAAYATLDEASTHTDLARDDIERARDEARSAYGTAEATSVFNNALASIKLAARAITDAIVELPPLDEGDGEES